MTPDSARRTFVRLMQEARRRKLTAAEKTELSRARQQLRRAARPAMNKRRKSSKKNKPRRRAARRSAAKNPKRIRMGRVIELRYDRSIGKSPGYYKHEFKTKPVVYYEPGADRIVIEGRR